MQKPANTIGAASHDIALGTQDVDNLKQVFWQQPARGK